MFDGSHRRRREINLSGRYSKNKRPTSATSPSFSASSAAPGAGPAAGGGGGSNDNKSALLEQARRGREGRRLTQLRAVSATHVQRSCRGYVTRKKQSAKWHHQFITLTKEFQKDGESHRMPRVGTDDDVDDEAKYVWENPMFVTLRKCASILSMRLSPSLLPFWTDGNLDKECKKDNSLPDVLNFASILLTLSRSRDSPTGSVLLEQPPSFVFAQNYDIDQSSARAQWLFSSERIANAALELLFDMGHKLDSHGNYRSDDSQFFFNLGQSASKLTDLVVLLCKCSFPTLLINLGYINRIFNKATIGERSQPHTAAAATAAAAISTSGGAASSSSSVPLLFLVLREWFPTPSIPGENSQSILSGIFECVTESIIQLINWYIMVTSINSRAWIASSPFIIHPPFRKQPWTDGIAMLLAVMLGTPKLKKASPLFRMYHARVFSQSEMNDINKNNNGTYNNDIKKKKKKDEALSEDYSVSWLHLVGSFIDSLEFSNSKCHLRVPDDVTTAMNTTSDSISAPLKELIKGRELHFLSNAIGLVLSPSEGCVDNRSGIASWDPARLVSNRYSYEQHRRAITVIKIMDYAMKRHSELTYLSASVASTGAGVLDDLFNNPTFIELSTTRIHQYKTDMDIAHDEGDELSTSSDDLDAIMRTETVSTRNNSAQFRQREQIRKKQQHSSKKLPTAKKLDLMMQSENTRRSNEILLPIMKSNGKNFCSCSRCRDENSDVRQGCGDDLLCQRSCRCRNERKDALKELSSLLGGGSLICQLGAIIFGIDFDDANQREHERVLDVRTTYCKILCSLLMTSGGLKSTSSPLLSKLAFAPTNAIANGLWKNIQTRIVDRCATLSSRDPFIVDNVVCDGIAASQTIIFAEIVSHILLAVDDDEFLLGWTVRSKQNCFNAADIVDYFNRVLSDVYWTNPVDSSDVYDSNGSHLSRARLLLSGTKLFNLLYKRWCRLEVPFCKEKQWWWRTESSTLLSIQRAKVGEVILQDTDGERMDVSELDGDGSDNEMEDVTGAQALQWREQGETFSEHDAENEALASSFRDPKMARLLTACPQAIPFGNRVSIFNALVEADKARTQSDRVTLQSLMMAGPGEIPGRVQVRIRRDNLYDDSLDQLNHLGTRLREKVQVTLVNQHGTDESGIDGGGMFKEFLDDLIKEAFDPKGSGLFSVSPVETLYVNLHALALSSRPDDLMKQYEFVGRVLGKAVYESILVEPQFALPFLNILLGTQNSLDDLKTLDPEVYRHLRSLRRMDEVSELGLNFEINSPVDGRGRFHGMQAVPLCKDGRSSTVTTFNVIQYVHLVANHKLNVEGSWQAKAFLRGFRDLVPAAWVRLFSARELQKLISGDDAVKGIDVDSMKHCMQYSGGFHPSQPIIQWFWEVVMEMTPEQQRKFLRFMTSCSRQPLLGFHALVPSPCIQQVRLQTESGNAKLPSSATCMNLLKLPNYSSKLILQEKLLYAIEAGAGFELT